VATISTDSDASKALASADGAFAEWRDEFEKYYDVRLFQVEGQSMEPSFHDKSTFVFKKYDASNSIQRWSITIFQFPLDPSRDFVKRVVGLPGETIEVRNSNIYVNGAAVEGDTYAKDAPNYTYGPKTVPFGMYFVLGDNRRNSLDSHAWGNSCSPQQVCDFVPTENILGVLPADTTACK
jgi:signal peptidase I